MIGRTIRSLTILLSVVLGQSALSQTTVTFVNTGKMNVSTSSPTSRVALYVPDAVRQLTVSGRTVEVIQNGITEIGGNFYQDAQTNVFAVGSNTLTTSTGKIRFVKDHSGVNRTISTQAVNIATFDRGLYYIAFPNIEISTNDSIVIPGKMGIDASTVHRVNAKTGSLVLRSTVHGVNAYDASLRITQVGTSENLVDLGAVVVERDMTTYRPSNGSTQLFGFATPFKNTQLSGYFAGNWVRRPLNTDAYGHTAYIYGNKDNNPADGTIDEDQYVYLAAEKLVPAQAYFIKPRPKEYLYSDLKSSAGLWYTGEPNPTLYDKGKFYFNGTVYTVQHYNEQLFADDVLFSKSINTSNLTSTVNWLVGNSYTCPISFSLLTDALTNSAISFSPYIYVYPAGASTYQACDISGNPDAIKLVTVDEIPAMSLFMLRVAKNSAQNGSIAITKSMLRHATVAHNTPIKVKGSRESTQTVSNQVIFRVNPSDNENLYDITAVGLRADASLGVDNYDMAKPYVNDDNIFQLYTLSNATTKLSTNGLPLTADSIPLVFNPSKYGGTFALSAQYTESLTTEGVWVYDKKVQKYIDMKTTPGYTFSSLPSDTPERFFITFNRPESTKVPEVKMSLNLYYSDNCIYLKNLEGQDVSSRYSVYSTQGKVLFNGVIDNFPEMTVRVKNIPTGVYMVKVTGKRTAISKFVVTRLLSSTN
jgi:hypothetical protein